MPELLLELLSEEIPARMQARAAQDLRRLLCDRLKAAALEFDTAAPYVTPRRLALVVEGLPKKQPDVVEEKKGPRLDAPERAIEGFLRGNGLVSIDQAEVRETDRGSFYFAVKEVKGRETEKVLPGVVYEVLKALTWPKSMSWGESRFAWVRPLHNILVVFNGDSLNGSFGLGKGDPEFIVHELTRAEGEAGFTLHEGYPPGPIPIQRPVRRLRHARVLDFNNCSVGHRFLAPRRFRVTDFADYRAKLKAAKVILDPAERRAEIAKQAKRKAARAKLELLDDPALLDEVTGLVEWPVVLMGRIDPEFMDLPVEVLTTAMRSHQKYLALRDKKGDLAPRFLMVANMETADKGKAIAAGNERVLRARLADARFFWDQDRKRTLENRIEDLDGVVFHTKLGSLGKKVERLKKLAAEIAKYVPAADKDAVREAARLCKADLMTGMVGEFPELQGMMGRYYALEEGKSPEIADAIALHYLPKGATDCPTTDVAATAVVIGLADRIDSLVGFFAIGETPTGSKDPYALRRAALGVIRLILDNGLRLPLTSILHRAFFLYLDQTDLQVEGELYDLIHGENFPVKIFFDVKFTGISHRILDKDGLFTSFIDYHVSNHCEFVDPTFEGYVEVQRRIGILCAYMEKFRRYSQDILHPDYARTDLDRQDQKELRQQIADAEKELQTQHATPVSEEILNFFAGRLKLALRESGVRHDLIAAVFALGGEDDLVRLLARVEALGAFLGTDDGEHLLVAYQRAANIVRIEEKRDKTRYLGADVSTDDLAQDEEKLLAARIFDAERDAAAALAREDFTGAMSVLAKLREPVDDFFDEVTVNTADAALRVNRLRLLARIGETLGRVADFSKIEG